MVLYCFFTIPFLLFSTVSAGFSFNKFPINLLLKNIQENKIDSILFSPSLEYIFVQDDAHDTSVSFLNPLIAKQVFDESVAHHIHSYILPSPDLLLFPTIAFLVLRYFLYVRSLNPSMMKNIPSIPFGAGNAGIEFDRFEPVAVSNISFVGYEEVLQECDDLFAFNMTSYQAVGAEIPKGILLEGPPGNGKTFLAKYIAQRTESSFISVSASEFMNMFVGMGAANVRNVFDTARMSAPCILFIDEIDSIGKRRSASPQGGSDEKDQTLNQILTEMDGFEENTGVFVIAATNRKELLDPALLRPGRFDRIIRLPAPDFVSRKAILREHAKNKAIDVSVDMINIAEMTEGFSGAQLKNLLNEAAILAARVKNTTILEKNIVDALEKITVGLVRKTDSRNEDTKERVAVHETGHAFLCIFFDHYFDLKKVSIQSTYEGAGGYTLFKERTGVVDGGLYTKDLLKKRLMIAMGGKAAETVYYGEAYVSLGATQDLKEANALARDMIEQYGMGDLLEPFYKEWVDTETGETIKYSDRTKTLVDKEAMILVTEAFHEAKQILEENKEEWFTIKDRLLEKTVLYLEDVTCLF